MTTTYRCAACSKDVEVEEIPLVDVIKITPCEVCVGAAEEAIREECYDKGYQEGWQAGYDTASEEWEEKAEEEEEYREDTSILLQNEEGKPREEIVEAKSQGFKEGFDCAINQERKEDTKDERS